MMTQATATAAGPLWPQEVKAAKSNASRNKFGLAPDRCKKQTTACWLNAFCDYLSIIPHQLIVLLVAALVAALPVSGSPLEPKEFGQIVIQQQQNATYPYFRPDDTSGLSELIDDRNQTVLPSFLQLGNLDIDSSSNNNNNNNNNNYQQQASSNGNETATNQTTRNLNNMLSNVSALSADLHANATANGQFSSETERYILIMNFFAEMAVFVIGTIGNGIVIAIILFFTKGNSVADIYIFNLAIADVTFLAGLAPLFITSINDTWVFGNIVCKLFMSLTALNQFASSFLLSLMSFDRYLAVCHPIFSQRYRHPKPAKLICFVLWILCLVLMVPIFIHARTNEENSTCGIFWPDSGMHERVFTLYSFCLGFLLPLVLIVVFYRCVVVKLKSTASGPASMQSERRTRNRETTNKRVSNLVKAIVATYGVCWLPYWVGQMLIGFSSQSADNNNGPPYYTFNQVAGCLSYLNSAVNPILYAFLSDSFRRRCSQFWHSIISFRLFKRWQTTTQANQRNGPHKPPGTQTSVADHHSRYENNSNIININNNKSLCKDQETIQTNVQSSAHVARTTGADADLEEGGLLHQQVGPEETDGDGRPQVKATNQDDQIKTVLAGESNSDVMLPPFRKKSATIHLLSFRKLKFKRRKKKHSLVKLNHLSCRANGSGFMGQTVLLT